jgi:integrase
MPKLIQNRLTVRRVETEARPGYYCDGLGLYLAVGESSKSWVFRYHFAGKRHDMGLGSVLHVPLAKARSKVRALHADLQDGVDPLAARREQRAALQPVHRHTVEQCVRAYVKDHLQGKTPRYRATWETSIAARVYPTLGQRDIATITSKEIADVFRPIWGGVVTREAVKRLSVVCNWAKAQGYRDDNPAEWGVLKFLLPEFSHATTHRPSLSWREIGSFMDELRDLDGIAYRAAEMVVLTGLRRDEVREASWQEFDLERGMWTIPASRMKTRKQHVVPLSSAALAVLTQMAAIRQNQWVFPGLHGPLHEGAILRAVQEVRAEITLHGFRATMWEWVREGTKMKVEGYDDDLVNVVLAHKIRDRVQAAYDRAEMIERRREFLEHWGRVCGSTTSGVVVPLKA